jgi:hypothetical protein
VIDDIIRPQPKKLRPQQRQYPAISQPRLNQQQPINQHQQRVQSDIAPIAKQKATQQRPINPVPRQFATPKASTKKKRTLRQRFSKFEKIFLIIAGPLFLAATIRFSKNAAVGEIAIAAYALLVLILQIPSRVTFWFVSMFLVSIPAVLLIIPDIQRSHNTALYAFMLLGVGLLSLILETRRLEARERRFR